MKRRRAAYFLAGSVLAITFVVYLAALRNGFVEWDDNQYVFENPHILSLNFSFLKWAFTTFYAGNWHPLTWVSLALDYALWGLNPLGYHMTNIVLHSLNASLVVLLILRLLEAQNERAAAAAPFLNESRMWAAAGATGLLFGIHPVHVESVVWVAERKDLLCAFFFLLSLIAYLRYASPVGPKDNVSSAGGRSVVFRHYGFSLVFFGLALLSKPMAVSLPLIVLLIDWYPLKRITSWRSLRYALIEKIPFAVLSAGASLLTIIAQKQAGAMGYMEFVPLSSRLLVAAKALMTYLWKMVIPVNLLFFYPYPRTISFSSPEYFITLLLAVGVTAAVILAGKRQRLWAAIWAYYVVTLLPVLGIVQVGSQAMADRYTYLPSIGPFLLAGLSVAWLWNRADAMRKRGEILKRFGAAAALCLTLFLSYAAVGRIGIWKDSITLWSSVIEKIPSEAFFAFHNRGLALSRLGEYDKAIEDYRKAIALKPQYADAYSNLGIALYKKGIVYEAVEAYKTALRLNPDLVNAHRNLATAFYMSGRVKEAIDHYLIVAKLRPDDATAQVDLGSAYGEAGQYDKAIEHFQTALRLSPDLGDAHYNIAIAYRMTGQVDRARQHFEAALRLNPPASAPAWPR